MILDFRGGKKHEAHKIRKYSLERESYGKLGSNLHNGKKSLDLRYLNFRVNVKYLFNLTRQNSPGKHCVFQRSAVTWAPYLAFIFLKLKQIKLVETLKCDFLGKPIVSLGVIRGFP